MIPKECKRLAEVDFMQERRSTSRMTTIPTI